jgi:hypothetical protein
MYDRTIFVITPHVSAKVFSMHGKAPNQNAPSSRSKPNRLYANKNSEVSGFSRPQNERSHSQNKFAASVTRILQT